MKKERSYFLQFCTALCNNPLSMKSNFCGEEIKSLEKMMLRVKCSQSVIFKCDGDGEVIAKCHIM